MYIDTTERLKPGIWNMEHENYKYGSMRTEIGKLDPSLTLHSIVIQSVCQVQGVHIASYSGSSMGSLQGCLFNTETCYTTKTQFALLGNLVLEIWSRLGLGAGFCYAQGHWIMWPLGSFKWVHFTYIKT